MPIHRFQEHLIYFSNIKPIIFHTLELIYQVGGFKIGKGDDGIGQVSVILVNDWVGIWMVHVLQQVHLQGRDPFKAVKDEGGGRCWFYQLFLDSLCSMADYRHE